MDRGGMDAIAAQFRDAIEMSASTCDDARQARADSRAAVAVARRSCSDAIETRIVGQHARALCVVAAPPAREKPLGAAFSVGARLDGPRRAA